MTLHKAPLVLLALGVLSASVHAAPVADGVSIQDQSTVDRHGNLHEHWLPLTNSGMELDSEAFYRKVGRPDLADAHAQRRDIAVGALVGGLALAGVSIYFAATQAAPKQPSLQSCDPSLPQSEFEACGQANVNALQGAASTGQAHFGAMLGTALGSALALGVSAYYFKNPEPISEAEAQGLATQYNWKPSVAVAPYVDDNGGGMVVAGRF